MLAEDMKLLGKIGRFCFLLLMAKPVARASRLWVSVLMSPEPGRGPIVEPHTPGGGGTEEDHEDWRSTVSGRHACSLPGVRGDVASSPKFACCKHNPRNSPGKGLSGPCTCHTSKNSQGWSGPLADCFRHQLYNYLLTVCLSSRA